MIELRWAVHAFTDEKPVLQFRTQYQQMGHGYTSDGVVHEYERVMGVTWSKWEDVPIVILEAASID